MYRGILYMLIKRIFGEQLAAQRFRTHKNRKGDEEVI